MVKDVKIDVAKMVARKDQVVKQNNDGILYLLKKNKISFFHGRGSFARQVEGGWEIAVKGADEQTLVGKQVVVATGSNARALPGVAFDEETVLSNDGALRMGAVPKKLALIGSGVIGLEMGSVWRRLGADVTILDKNLDRLRHLDQIAVGRTTTLASNRGSIERSLLDADLVVGAVLVAGARAPIVVTDDMVQSMKPGSVIVDVAVDQGGCIATTRETTHSDPVYEQHGVVHYAVGNMPGAVPHTSTYALTNATLPYQLEIAMHGARGAAERNSALLRGVNTANGHVTMEAVALELGYKFVEPFAALS
jgi:hypothetical protein